MTGGGSLSALIAKLSYESGLDADHQLVAAVVVDVDVRVVSIVAGIDECAPRSAQAATRAHGETIAVVLVPDLESTPVEEVGIVVAADAVFSARVDPPAAGAALRERREKRMPRRRSTGEIGPLLDVPAVVELELVAQAHKSRGQREPRIGGKALLPPVEILEAGAASDAPELVAPAQVAPRVQAASRLQIDHRCVLKERPAEVGRVEIATGAGLQTARIRFVGQAGAQSQKVELVQIRVFAQDEAAVGIRAAPGFTVQAAARGGERFDERIALVADRGRRRIGRKGGVAVVAPGHRGHDIRPRQRWRAAESR